MAEYRVVLDVYNGPLDLLLYLIRREEVDIHDIPIVRITGQYIQHVDVLKALDPDLIGEFLVMAATLMEIKTRMLLPAPPPEEGGQDTLQIDPRAELVRQLLEYKAFKDTAEGLAGAAAAQAMKFPRGPAGLSPKDQGELDLEDVQVWDLLEAFSKLMETIGHDLTQREVIYDDTPIEMHAEEILGRLSREGATTFRNIFAGRTSRSEIVGLFLAILELVRRKRILIVQESNFREIRVDLNPTPPEDNDKDTTNEDAEAGAGHSPPPSSPRVP